MLYTFLFITLLVGLATTIAYLADRLGRYVGKKRLSLLGWRPKRTGQIIGMLSGVVVMFMTLGISSLLSRGAVAVVLNAQRAAQELHDLRSEQQELETQIIATNERLQYTEDARATLSHENEVARADLLRLQNQFTTTSEQLNQVNDNLQQVIHERTEVQQELNSLQNTLQNAELLLHERQNQLDLAQNNLLQASNELALQQRLLAMENARISSLTNEYQSLEFQSDFLNNENRQLQQQNYSLLADNTRFKQQTERMQHEIDNLNTLLQNQQCLSPTSSQKPHTVTPREALAPKEALTQRE